MFVCIWRHLRGTLLWQSIFLCSCSQTKKPNRFQKNLIVQNTNKSLFIWEEVISVDEKTFRQVKVVLFCSYGEMFSRLPGKVFRCDLDFVKCKQTVFPLSGKVVFTWDKNYLGHWDLACQQARSRYPGKLFVPYERNATFHCSRLYRL